uniref:Uncharacterized protein n=1 Tax=viral metagenome TaxID=1070528 RepID=A0A6C0C701_9ZZZZ
MGSPINYLDYDLLNYMLPDYVAKKRRKIKLFRMAVAESRKKMRRKVWWENLFDLVVRCLHGDYNYDHLPILDNKYPHEICDKLDNELFNFSHIISYCEDFLEGQFIREFGCGHENPDPKCHTDYIPFYKLFIELTGRFDTSQLSDFRMNGNFNGLTEHYKHLNRKSPYIKNIIKDTNLNHMCRDIVLSELRTNIDKARNIKEIFNIDFTNMDHEEMNIIIIEKIEEIENRQSYTEKLTDEDKNRLIEILNNYYYVMFVTKDLGGVSCYDIPENMIKIKENIEKIKLM